MKRCGPTGYPDDWESCCLWNGKISAHFGYPEDGWVLMSLLTTAYNGSLVIYLSDTYDPFWDMIDWLKAIADNKLPASLNINEEGSYKELIVRPYLGCYSEYADIELRVNGDFWDEDKKASQERCYFLSRANRSQLIDEFTRRLDQWLREDYDPNGWNRSWREDNPDNPLTDLRNLDIAGIKARMSSACQSSRVGVETANDDAGFTGSE